MQDAEHSLLARCVRPGALVLSWLMCDLRLLVRGLGIEDSHELARAIQCHAEWVLEEKGLKYWKRCELQQVKWHCKAGAAVLVELKPSGAAYNPP